MINLSQAELNDLITAINMAQDGLSIDGLRTSTVPVDPVAYFHRLEAIAERLQMLLTENQSMKPQVKVEAMRIAKHIVKAMLRAGGIKISAIEAPMITMMAKLILGCFPEIYTRAEDNLKRITSSLPEITEAKAHHEKVI